MPDRGDVLVGVGMRGVANLLRLAGKALMRVCIYIYIITLKTRQWMV